MHRSDARGWGRQQLEQHQLMRLNDSWSLFRDHPLYREKLRTIDGPLVHLKQLETIPPTLKSDLVPNQVDEPSRLFTLPQKEYLRWHQTSGTRGWPMPIMDTATDWHWWLDCWQYVLDAANINADDVAMMAFSFGPFIGFWSAHDALIARGAMVIPGGGLSSFTRLKLIAQTGATVLCATPTYAMHLANVATENGIDLASGSVTRIIVAGEPGGSVPSVRRAIEQRWGARVIDHAGASEIGAWGFATEADDGLHVIESEFIAEFLPVESSEVDGNLRGNSGLRELVLTNLGRTGGPLLRYRTGDVVCPVWDHSHDCRFVKLEGGILGRIDDMIVIRGVNIFPSSIDAIVRELAPTCEYQVVLTRELEMDQLTIQLESDSAVAAALELSLRERLALRVSVDHVAPGSLPRFEGKSQRWLDHRS